MKSICHSCDSENLFFFNGCNKFFNVSSDCQKLKLKSQLILCKKCNLLQKHCTKKWGSEVSKIYKNYKMYSQSSTFSEQKVLSKTKFESRSSFIFNWIKKKNILEDKGNYLDFGCGIGNTLNTAKRALNNWDIYGYEPQKANIEKYLQFKDHKKIFTKLKFLKKFNLITLIHVLEHIRKPKQTLKQVASLLNENGVCLIQVPYFNTNPFDLIIYDHCSHFEPSDFFNLCKNTDLEIITANNSIINKELTIVLKKKKIKNKVLKKIKQKKKIVIKQLNWLNQVLVKTKAQLKSDYKLGIFGTSIAAAWMSNNIKNNVDFYIDEDDSRINNKFLNKEIVSISNIPKFSSISIPFTYKTSKLIKSKIKQKNIEIITTPMLKLNS